MTDFVLGIYLIWFHLFSFFYPNLPIQWRKIKHCKRKDWNNFYAKFEHYYNTVTLQLYFIAFNLWQTLFVRRMQCFTWKFLKKSNFMKYTKNNDCKFIICDKKVIIPLKRFLIGASSLLYHCVLFMFEGKGSVNSLVWNNCDNADLHTIGQFSSFCE